MSGTLTLLPYDWSEQDVEEKLQMRAWCLDEKSRAVLINIQNFPVMLTVELPMLINGVLCIWSRTKLDLFMSTIDEIVSSSGHAPLSSHFQKKTKLYGFSKTPVPTLSLHFKSIEAARHVAAILKRPITVSSLGKLQFTTWETKFSNVRKLLTCKKLKYSSWFKCTATLVQDSSAKVPEYTTDFNTLTPHTATIITNPKICAYDIECNSQNVKKFPSALSAPDVCFIITVVYQLYKKPETARNYAVVWGECDKKDVGVEYEIIHAESELECIRAFEDLIDRLDPDVLTGYNIDGFDVPYLTQRLVLLGQLRGGSVWRDSGRITGERSYSSDADRQMSNGMLIEGKILSMAGRISIDIFKHIRANYSFRIYKLDYVAKQILGEAKGKLDVSPEEIFRAYQTKDRDLMSEVVSYGMIDAVRTMELFDKVNLWDTLLAMTAESAIRIVEFYAKGQSIRCKSQLYDTCFKNDVICSLTPPAPETEKYAGGYVGDCTPGIHEYVITLDFNSLY
ncbi:MAG: 3'-5' exonuclease, partial [Acetobacteraceae bacterium]